MALTTVTPGSWVTITTTTGDTVVENQSLREMYISTESSPSSLKDGKVLEPWKAVVVSGGLPVKISVFEASGQVYFGGI